MWHAHSYVHAGIRTHQGGGPQGVHPHRHVCSGVSKRNLFSHAHPLRMTLMNGRGQIDWPPLSQITDNGMESPKSQNAVSSEDFFVDPCSEIGSFLFRVILLTPGKWGKSNSQTLYPKPMSFHLQPAEISSSSSQEIGEALFFKQ